jgi:hypothetical protein
VEVEESMSYIYRAATAHQEELLREAQRSQGNGSTLKPEEKTPRRSTRNLYLRLSSDLLRKSAEDAPTAA